MATDYINRPQRQDPRTAYSTIRDIDQVEENTYAITVFANQGARSPIDLVLQGMSTDNYQKNPVVLWSHDRGIPPIGRTTRLDKTDTELRAEFEFLEGDPLAASVKNAWDRGFLRAASVGWWPVRSEPTDIGWIDMESDLLEWSIVTVPADPDAVRGDPILSAHCRAISQWVEDGVTPLDKEWPESRMCLHSNDTPEETEDTSQRLIEYMAKETQQFYQSLKQSGG